MFSNLVTSKRVLWRARTLNKVYKLSTASFSSRTITKYEPHHIGIDLGTTNTYVSVIEPGNNNHPKLFKKLPSQACLTSKVINYEVLYENIITGVKRLLGRKFDDPIVQTEIKRVPYKIIRSPMDEDAWIEASYAMKLPPTTILVNHFEKIKESVESYLGSPVSRAVFSYPTLMEGMDDQIRHISFAAEVIGIKHQQFISEPVAAALAYVNGGVINKETGRVFAVVDLGGRTFNVSLLQISFGGRFTFISPTKSDLYLGGEDFDSVLLDHLVSKWNLSEEGKRAMVTRSTLQARKILWSFGGVIEEAKIQLSLEHETTMKMPVFDETRKLRTVDISLTRSKFESVVEHLIEKVRDQCQSSLREAGITANDVDELLLVGGMAKVPIVQKVVTQVFGKSPCTGVNPEEAVALGAAAAVHAGHFGEDAWN